MDSCRKKKSKNFYTNIFVRHNQKIFHIFSKKSDEMKKNHIYFRMTILKNLIKANPCLLVGKSYCAETQKANVALIRSGLHNLDVQLKVIHIETHPGNLF